MKKIEIVTKIGFTIVKQVDQGGQTMSENGLVRSHNGVRVGQDIAPGTGGDGLHERICWLIIYPYLFPLWIY